MHKESAHQIALYIRVSTEEQAENPEGSIKNQEERLRATVQLKNLSEHWDEIAGVYIDRGKSGKDTKRPELQRLLLGIREKKITLVLVSELSRLTRSIRDFSAIKELMDENGCGLYSLRESFDTTTAAGEMVMFIMANLAQFERRQVSERVAANFQTRAARGLYNGGVLPIGYRLIPEKRGFLAIHEERAAIVRMAFTTFLMEGSLSKVAKSLNENGHQIRRSTQGGGSRPRLGHFTCQNLRDILQNKAYVGIRRYKAGKEMRETQAEWEPKSRLSGKSAHGNGGKIPYYEHGWATKAQGCLVKKALDCQPHRISGKRLEQHVWEQVESLLTQPTIADEILSEAKRLYSEGRKDTEIERHRAKIRTLESQIQTLSERLGELPKSVSAVPIYQQMEKLERLKAHESEQIQALQSTGNSEMPVQLKTYRDLLSALNKVNGNEVAKTQIIESLIHKIEITPDGYRLHYYVGENSIQKGLARRDGSHFTAEILSSWGSNSLQNGGRCRD